MVEELEATWLCVQFRVAFALDLNISFDYIPHGHHFVTAIPVADLPKGQIRKVEAIAWTDPGGLTLVNP